MKGKGTLVVIATVCAVIYAACAKRYDLPPGWTGNNSKLHLTTVDLPSSSKDTPSSSFRILQAPNNADITSDNATFALVFFNFGNTGAFYLSVMMQAPDPSAALPVWIADRSQSVGENAYLFLTQANGKLLLLDRAIPGMPVWGVLPSDIVGIELLESGNLRFYTQDGTVVWESFRDTGPTDVLLPNQLLTPGVELFSRANESSLLPGEYSAVVDSTGLTLSVKRLGLVPQPYYIWHLEQVKCAHPAFGMIGSSIQLQCGLSTLSIPFSDQTLLPVLRLDADGDVVVYSFHPEKSAWTPVFKLSALHNDSCKLPNACGPYGICEPGGKCRCIDVQESGNETYSTVTRAGRCSDSVPRGAPQGLPQADACANENLNHHFVNVTGVSYFALPYLRPENQDTVDHCAASCKWNCSCAALFYNKRTRECFFVVDELLGSLTIDPMRSADMIAMLKFANRHLLTGPQETESPEPLAENTSGGKTRKIAWVAAAVGGGCLIVLLSACVVLVQRTRKQNKKDLNSLELDEFLSGVQGLPQRFSYSALEAATGGFTTKLGSGGFGSVYEGLLNGQTIAVKKLEGSGSHGARQFIAEVATIGSISHVNVVKLRGFCVESSHRLLVYEFMPNGSLDRWLFPNREHSEDGNRTPDRRTLSWDRRMEVAVGTARGLAYLHEECREPIIHLDVKPQNILLDERFVAKVADFGMSKLLNDRDVSHVVTGVRGTPGYLAPEWLLQSVATKKCDVYSYGMVLLELIGGRRNIEASLMDSGGLWWYFPAWVVNEVREGKFLRIADKKIRDSVPEKQVVKMVHIALWCVQESPGLRPTMHEVLQMIEGLKEVPEPPMTFHFAVQTMVDITASRDCVSMAYVSPPSMDISSLIR